MPLWTQSLGLELAFGNMTNILNGALRQKLKIGLQHLGTTALKEND